MAFYWQTKKFNTQDKMREWIANNRHKYQIREIFVNNAYCVEYRDLTVI